MTGDTPEGTQERHAMRRTIPGTRILRDGERLALRVGRTALGGAMDRLDEATVQRLGGHDRALWVLFTTLARMVAVSRPGLVADVQFVVDADGGPRRWVLSADAGRVSARRGELEDPDLTLRLALADLLALAGGRTTGITLATKGRVDFDGDLVAALALMRAAEGAPRA
jgi:hypothetical protein